MDNDDDKKRMVERLVTITENLSSSFVKHYPKYKSKQSVYKYIKIYEEQV